MARHAEKPVRAKREWQTLTTAFARLCRTYELILHAASEGICSLDSSGRIGFVNPAAGQMLGWPVEDLVGMPICMAVHGAAHEGRPCRLLSMPEGGRHRDVFRHRRGSALAVEYSLAPIYEDEERLGTVLVFTDIGDRERAERALQTSLAALQESNARLSATRDRLVQAEKLAAIGRMAAGIAHEINSPLGYIGANISSLWHDTESLIALVEAYQRVMAAPDDLQAASALAAARRRCDLDYMREDAPALLRETSAGLAKVARIVRELREYADAGAESEWQRVDLDRLLDAAVADAFAREDKTVRVERHYGQVPQVSCLAAALRQALAAIALNALQALPAGGRLGLKLCTADGGAAVQIEDDGVGIAPEHLARVFDPFFTTRPVGAGIGMGLAVADSTVRRHGGSIEISSRIGGGTRVSVRLPFASDDVSKSG